MNRSLPRNTILVGDVRDRLGDLPDSSIDTVITSPPYVALRSYGGDGEIGASPDAEVWVDELREVGRELARVLKPTGSWWLNLGDSYSRHIRSGTPPKSLMMAPERLAIALIDDGWIIRNKVIWKKNNTMPASVADRLACKWEVVYFLVRSPTYHFDLDAIRVPHKSQPRRRPSNFTPVSGRLPNLAKPSWAGPNAGNNSGLARLKAQGLVGHPLGKNPGDIFELATSNLRSIHRATFPESLVRTPLLATCPEKVCSRCGTPWRRERYRVIGQLATKGDLRRACRCRAISAPGIVLDCFMGSGTTAVVAETHGRDWIGIDLNPAFARLADERIKSARNKDTQTKARAGIAA